MCKMNYYSRKVDLMKCADIIQYLILHHLKGAETAKIYLKLSSSSLDSGLLKSRHGNAVAEK